MRPAGGSQKIEKTVWTAHILLTGLYVNFSKTTIPLAVSQTVNSKVEVRSEEDEEEIRNE